MQLIFFLFWLVNYKTVWDRLGRERNTLGMHVDVPFIVVAMFWIIWREFDGCCVVPSLSTNVTQLSFLVIEEVLVGVGLSSLITHSCKGLPTYNKLYIWIAESYCPFHVYTLTRVPFHVYWIQNRIHRDTLWHDGSTIVSRQCSELVGCYGFMFHNTLLKWESYYGKLPGCHGSWFSF